MYNGRIAFASPFFIVIFSLLQLTGCQSSSNYTSIQSGISAAPIPSEITSSLQLERDSLAAADAEDELGKLFMVKEGKASYYADRFHGRLTANGERFNMHELTAAHKSLPFGSMVRVTNLNNGRKVMVRINDRGPYIKGRIIDLSLEAAKEINLLKKGVAKVRIEVYEGDS
ncbi:MAG: septal ring lytic transglycosylase RlpA family protein [Chlorobium phaeobacteroides]|uniref:Probable endolytic peptidoglycan transglycosylase RlpA n=1 Tax=Chlorobium phaeobacteroides (strain BS1) TaxID=331678 RepID=B3EKZ4_CHLPB|nr:septal ring lytic transglycosylase RlpA family protein [Chlorobium phaeobacteroides]MBL6955319.1 septal ring lytic transglycosylase RlpA family protein [Chlorobium phaeobacteroides]